MLSPSFLSYQSYPASFLYSLSSNLAHVTNYKSKFLLIPKGQDYDYREHRKVLLKYFQCQGHETIVIGNIY